jgi:MtrB/PioB family decaheme-associated outer membrane protein
MKRKTTLLIIYLLTSGLVPGAALAEDTPSSEEEEALVPAAFISKPILNEIELGIGYVSDDAYKFGRYSGLQTKGAFAVGDIKARSFDEDGRFWSVRGTHLGLESRYLRLEGGVQGSHKFFLEYDELPNYKNNTVQTPFTGIGSNNLVLPSPFDINNMELNSFELETRRKRAKVGALFVPKEHWQFDIDFSHENKQGVDATGAAIHNATNPSVGNIGNTKTSLLPEPIDQDTDMVNATLHYAGDAGQLDLKYHMSLFDNNNDSLTWQDPFNPVATGSMALAPDNEFHQLSLTGAYTLPYNSRLTGLISTGRMTQNQDFQAYSVGGTLPATSSLNGEVWLTTAQLKLASRPVSKLRLNAELRYNERDNQTPVNSYDYVVLDSASLTGSATNRPYSYKNNRIKLDANYRFNAITSLRGGYKYNEIKRSYIDAEREDTQENTLFAKWKIKAHATVDLALYGEASSRDGSDYNTPTNQSLAMRKYNLADRDRTKVGASIDYMATDKLFLSARADYNQDDYKNSTIGLTEATQPVYTVDFSYQPANNITTYGYYTYENIQSSQAGADVSNQSSTVGWEADFDDTFNTAGVGAKLTDLGKWDVGADIVYSKSNGNIVMKDIVNPGTEDQYPDTKTELTSVKLWTRYNHSKQLSYKLGYWFEEYSEDNWNAGLQPYDPTAAANILLLGNEALDYNVQVITASARYQF